MADDTNVWVNNSQSEESTNPDGSTKTVQKPGMKKTMSLLGMVQRLAVKRSNGAGLDSVSVHCPSQLLPRQNSATILSRMRKWSLYGSQGCSKALGGETVYEQMKKIPLKMHIWCWVLIWCIN